MVLGGGVFKKDVNNYGEVKRKQNKAAGRWKNDVKKNFCFFKRNAYIESSTVGRAHNGLVHYHVQKRWVLFRQFSSPVSFSFFVLFFSF